jgi:hypothetical protein
MAAPTAVNTHPTRGEKPGFPFSARMLASMNSKVHIIKAGLCDNEPGFPSRSSIKTDYGRLRVYSDFIPRIGSKIQKILRKDDQG